MITESPFYCCIAIKKENDVHEGKWISVGGKLEEGETPEECAIREIYEETHLTVEKMDFRGIITFPEFTPGHDWYTYVFKITGFSGDLISNEESREGTLEWVPYEQVLEKQLGKGIMKSLNGFWKTVHFSQQSFTITKLTN